MIIMEKNMANIMHDLEFMRVMEENRGNIMRYLEFMREMTPAQLAHSSLVEYRELIDKAVKDVTNFKAEGRVYLDRKNEDENEYVYLQMMVNRFDEISTTLEILQALTSAVEIAVCFLSGDRQQPATQGGSEASQKGNAVMNVSKNGHIVRLDQLSDGEIKKASGDDITQRLVRAERKLDLLVDALGGYRNYYNGSGLVIDGIFDIQTGIDSVYDLLKYGFPEAAKRAEENKLLHDEGIRPLSR